MAMLTAPEIRHYFGMLTHRASGNSNDQTAYDAKTYQILNAIFDHIKQIAPRDGTTDVWDLWFQAPRGPIEKFGVYQEWLEDGEISSYEEFQEVWLSYFPDEECWYPFTAIERQEDGYRGIFFSHRIIIEQCGEPPTGFPLDVHEFAEWLLQSVDTCIEALREGRYNQFIDANLPVQHRTGTILRKNLWSVFPQNREEFLSGISEEDVDLFVKYIREREPDQQSIAAAPLKEMSANDYFQACAIGYATNQYFGQDKTPREQYYLHADGRDDGLGKIDPNSPSAFLSWFTDQSRYGGHPWEIARGGNFTHISLYPQRSEDGFTFLLAGSSTNRTIETVKFYLALRKAGLPVYIKDGPILADRLTGNEMIGIVPQGVIPVYCENLFPDERIISFMNLDDEKLDEVVRHCTWQPLPQVRLLPHSAAAP